MAESKKLATRNLDLDTNQYPFSSALFDPDVTNGLVIKDLLDSAIPYSPYVVSGLFGGRGWNRQNRTMEKSESSKYSSLSRASAVACQSPLTKAGLIWLLEEYAIPPGYIEILVNNNGVEAFFTTYTVEGATPDALHLFLKFPTSSALNSAIYFRHNLTSRTTVCFICGDSLQRLAERLQQVFPDESSLLQAKTGKDPFIVCSSILAEYSVILEQERRRLDLMVREQEAKTGMSAHEYDVSLRASAQQYSDLVKQLHRCEGQLVFFARTVAFQASCAGFLSEQHSRTQEIRSKASKSENHISNKPLEENIIGHQKVHDSLNLSASFQRNRLLQVESLTRRVQTQLSVVANLMSQIDSKSSITVAEESTKLALAAARDSSAMRSIAVVTMFFLPGTFISTLFAMPFFHVGAEDDVKFVVESQWWLYFVVTVPVTILVFILWGTWSKMKKNGEGKVSQTKPDGMKV